VAPGPATRLIPRPDAPSPNSPRTILQLLTQRKLTTGQSVLYSHLVVFVGLTILASLIRLAILDDMTVSDFRVLSVVGAGAKLFQGMRCTACHTAEMKTDGGHVFEELRNQAIHPDSDLLLHGMGDGLADKVMSNPDRVGYLHDGRASNLTEAILWHGGEATQARLRFRNLGKADRESL
jgi:CxxC motif-containing protein (DUF1111 family)